MRRAWAEGGAPGQHRRRRRRKRDVLKAAAASVAGGVSGEWDKLSSRAASALSGALGAAKNAPPASGAAPVSEAAPDRPALSAGPAGDPAAQGRGGSEPPGDSSEPPGDSSESCSDSEDEGGRVGQGSSSRGQGGSNSGESGGGGGGGGGSSSSSGESGGGSGSGGGGSGGSGRQLVFHVGPVPHEWLFQHVAAVVHHGGAGTVAAGLRAGKPTMICPFFGDQYFWARAVDRARVGVDLGPVQHLTAARLADGIGRLQLGGGGEGRMAARAAAMARAFEREDGAGNAVEAFYRHFPVDSMVCDVSVWLLGGGGVPGRDGRGPGLAAVRLELNHGDGGFDAGVDVFGPDQGEAAAAAASFPPGGAAVAARVGGSGGGGGASSRLNATSVPSSLAPPPEGEQPPPLGGGGAEPGNSGGWGGGGGGRRRARRSAPMDLRVSDDVFEALCRRHHALAALAALAAVASAGKGSAASSEAATAAAAAAAAAAASAAAAVARCRAAGRSMDRVDPSRHATPLRGRCNWGPPPPRDFGAGLYQGTMGFAAKSAQVVGGARG